MFDLLMFVGWNIMFFQPNSVIRAFCDELAQMYDKSNMSQYM